MRVVGKKGYQWAERSDLEVLRQSHQSPGVTLSCDLHCQICEPKFFFHFHQPNHVIQSNCILFLLPRTDSMENKAVCPPNFNMCSWPQQSKYLVLFVMEWSYRNNVPKQNVKKWSKIKQKKGVNDMQKSATYGKFGKVSCVLWCTHVDSWWNFVLGHCCGYPKYACSLVDIWSSLTIHFFRM